MNRKSTCGCVTFAIGVGTQLKVLLLTNLNSERLGCTDFCPGQRVN